MKNLTSWVATLIVYSNAFCATLATERSLSWQCEATDSQGHFYFGKRSSGQSSATLFALLSCQEQSQDVASCAVTNCRISSFE